QVGASRPRRPARAPATPGRNRDHLAAIRARGRIAPSTPARSVAAAAVCAPRIFARAERRARDVPRGNTRRSPRFRAARERTRHPIEQKKWRESAAVSTKVRVRRKRQLESIERLRTANVNARLRPGDASDGPIEDRLEGEIFGGALENTEWPGDD